MVEPRTESDIKEMTKLLIDELEKVQENLPEVTDDLHRIFLYFIAEQFHGVDFDDLKICEGKLDKKIDFYTDDEDAFIACQCKLPEIIIEESQTKIHTFGPDLINEVENMLTFLTDDEGILHGNSCSQEARNRFRAKKEMSEEDGSAYLLKVVLAYFGKLTEPALEELNKIKKKWVKSEGGIEINIIDFDKISTILGESLIAKERPSKLKLPVGLENQVHTNTWAYMLVPAITFCEYFEEFKMSLFDLNVRYFLEKSHVNKEIMKSLNEDKGIKNFHLLNNGITVSCKSWQFPKQKKSGTYITLHHPQIINGCQTVVSLYRAYSQMEDERKRRLFKEKCKVPVRLINTHDDDLLDDVVMASNNQNKMSPRNLKSNTRYQKLLQRKFLHLNNKWFYERKDGEFSSLLKHPQGGFKEKDFCYSKNIHRKLSNEELAKTWLSFIGFSKDAGERINAFGFEENSRYEMLFEMVPDLNHWNFIAQGPQVSFTEENFIPKSPSPEQYLLSYIIYNFVKANLPSPQKNKKMCHERLERSGLNLEAISPEEIKQKTLDDEEYVINQILYNMKEVIVELYSWILVKTYGPIDENAAKKIIRLLGFEDLVKNPNFKSYTSKLRDDDNEKDNILFNCYGFIKHVVERWYHMHQDEYLIHTRRTRFLHNAKTISQLKQTMLDTNKHTKKYPFDWKPPEKDFIESLPSLQSV